MKRFEKLKEKVFIARLHAQDTEAFAEVYNFYISRIYRFIFFKINTVEEAQDLTSEVFLKVWQYIYNNKGKIENLNAFLYQTARNIVIDHYRKNSRNETSYNEEIAYMVPDPRQEEMILNIHKKTEFEGIEKIVKKLRDEYKEIVILKYIEELDDREIAKILNKSKGAVRVLIHRALNKIRETINSEEHE